MPEQPQGAPEPGHCEIHAVAGPEVFAPSEPTEDQRERVVVVLRPDGGDRVMHTLDGAAVEDYSDLADLLEGDPDLDPEALADAIEEQAVMGEAVATGGMPEEARERLRARRAAQRVPLLQRRALRSLGPLDADADDTAPATHPDGRPRGIAALIPDPSTVPSGPLPGTWVGGRIHHAEPAEPVEATGPQVAREDAWPPDIAERRRERTSPPQDDPALRILGRHRLEADWLVTPTTRVLHHAPLSDAECEELLSTDYVARDAEPTPFRLSCERTAWAVARPNRIERLSTPRCEGCCEVLGYPAGHGSPQADASAEPRLLERLAQAGQP